MKKLHNVTTIAFAAAISGAAISELSQSEVVIQSLKLLDVPLRLLYLLGVLKLLGAATLLFSKNVRLKEWAYAGFIFNLVGAVFLLATAGKVIMPDSVIAPAYLVLCLISYSSFLRLTIRNPAFLT